MSPIFRPVQPASLVRLGRSYDGGYLVDSRDVKAADSIIGLGIYDDWSFEKAFVAQNDVPVLAYDGSVSAPHFAGRIVRAAGNLQPRVFLRSIGLFVDYLRFFSGRRRHFQSFVASTELKPSVTFADVISELKRRGLSRTFLKVDIEGAEYAVLDELVANAGMTTGLAIEFHDCIQHIDEIGRFVERYSLRLVHVHANNFSPVSPDGVPDALELTFSSSPQNETGCELPHALDRPNKRGVPDIAIAFSEAGPSNPR
jgi:hypothetical protein